MATKVCRTREGIYLAMFALVKPLECTRTPTPDKPFRTVTRDVKETQRFPPLEQPVLMQFEMNESNVYSGRLLVKKIFTVVYIFGVAHKKSEEGASMLNPLIDKVEAIFTSSDDEPITLGGLVENVQLIGNAGKDHGDNSTKEFRQAAYYLPVEIIMPSC